MQGIQREAVETGVLNGAQVQEMGDEEQASDASPVAAASGGCGFCGEG